MLEILDFLQEHKKSVIAVVIMLLCLVISGKVAGSFTKSRDEAARALADVQNQVDDLTNQLNQPVTKYRELDHGYIQSWVDQDMELLIGDSTGLNHSNEWLSAFLTWNDGAEYEQNRNWFVEALSSAGGPNNTFLTDIMRIYDHERKETSDMGKIVDSNNVSCKLGNTEFYVENIDDSTGRYDYVIRAYFSTGAFENKYYDAIDNTVCFIVTVSVNHNLMEDGTVESVVDPASWVVAAGPAVTQ